jgi:hypothetical protein
LGTLLFTRRDAAPPAVYPSRLAATEPAAQLQAYIEAWQAADELRDAQFPDGGPALNHRPLDSEGETILLDTLSTSRLRAYKNLYQQYCNRSHTGKTFTDLYHDIHDLVKHDSDGVKSSTRDSDAEIEDSGGSRGTRASSKSSNSYSSRRQAQIQQAVCQSTATRSQHLDQQQYQLPVIQHWLWVAEQRASQSTSHGTKCCSSTKCFEKNCGKTLASADERKIYFIQEYGHLSKPATPPLKSSLKDSQGTKVKFVKSQRLMPRADQDAQSTTGR